MVSQNVNTFETKMYVYFFVSKEFKGCQTYMYKKEDSYVNKLGKSQ